MSGVGKTVFSSALRRSSGWFHYSADYRIGTRYLAEHILDNIKYKIMSMGDPFVANLLRSDSIYINHNISVDNLDPVSTFLGMYGDPLLGGLTKATFLERQELYRSAEIQTMIDVKRFIAKSSRIYGCNCFVNDASGSLCEIINLREPNDEVIKALTTETLILYIKPDKHCEVLLKERARNQPKPLFYNPDFIHPHLEHQPVNGKDVNPVEFAKPLFPHLLSFRKPRYEKIADNWGFTMESQQLIDIIKYSNNIAIGEQFVEKLFEVVMDQSNQSASAAKNLSMYIEACEKRREQRAN